MSYKNHFQSSGRALKKLHIKMAYAKMLADLSTCSRLQIGCIVTSLDFYHDYAIGYNGPARGEPHTACEKLEGDCGCIHAEANAIAKLATERNDFILVVTYSPCKHCAGLILNCSRIACVIFDYYYRDRSAIARLTNRGISVINLESLAH